MFDVFQNVLAEIKKDTSSVAFKTFFEDVELVELDEANQTAKVSAPNIFKKRMLETKYHFGNMDEFDSVLLEQLRRHYSYPNLGLGHALDYSITQLNSFPREEETGINAAFDGAQK